MADKTPQSLLPLIAWGIALLIQQFMNFLMVPWVTTPNVFKTFLFNPDEWPEFELRNFLGRGVLHFERTADVYQTERETWQKTPSLAQ